MVGFHGSKLKSPRRNWARRPSETGFRVTRNNFLVQGQKEGNWFRLAFGLLLAILLLLRLLLGLLLVLLLTLLLLLELLPCNAPHGGRNQC